MLTLLHVSDVHFGAKDQKGEQLPITDALVRAVRGQTWVPDLCVFSGDLAFSGAEQEFEQDTRWLAKLVAPPTRLFIVPGNHDVARKDASAMLRSASADEAAFGRAREDLKARLERLDTFRRWHGGASAAFGERLLSDWSDPFGSHATVEVGDRTLHLVGLNTALLSHADDDEGRLVQDVATLNGSLGRRQDDYDCVVVVGHHPVSHRMESAGGQTPIATGERCPSLPQRSSARAERGGVRGATGQSLATLECGAAYQGSQWPQYFAFYRLDFQLREISTRTFLFSPNAGEWVLDGRISRSVVAPLPPPRVTRPQAPPRAGQDFPFPGTKDGASHTAKKAGILDETSGIGVREVLELHARRAEEVAKRAEQNCGPPRSHRPFLT